MTAPTDVPDDATPATCERCGRPFPDQQLLALHRGLEHESDLTDDERRAYASAYETEQADLRRFRLLALGALVVLYFGFLIVYAILS